MNTHGLTLSLDTCVSSGSAVIADGGDIVSARVGISRKSGGDGLASSVEAMLKENRFRFEDIVRVIVTRGPGSFTGVRSGLSFAKGLCRGRTIEVMSCLATEALAMAAGNEHRSCLTMIFAGKNETAVQRFEREAESGRFHAEGPHRVYGNHELADELAKYGGFVVAENRVCERLADLHSQEGRVMELEILKAPDNVGALALRYLSEAGTKEGADLTPVYTREFRTGGRAV